MRLAANARSASLLLALLLALSARVRAQAPVPAAVRADGLAALVGGYAPGEEADVILRSDVELRARLALFSRGAGASAASANELAPSLLDATLAELVGEALIAREAQRVQVSSPSAADVQREKDRIVLMTGGRDRLGRLLDGIGAREGEIDAIARRRAVASAFLSANLEGAMVVTDGEIEQRYRAEAATFAGHDPTEARELIRARLAREALARNIERWVRVLRARTPVHIVASFKAS